MNYSEKFLELVKLYRSIELGKYNPLKSITLAQWILETGRGSTKLAQEHNNFAGLKWRSEMVGIATPVAYTACDGPDMYCKFDSLESFILGYWKFIERPPYRGFDLFINEPVGFMTFIVKAGYCPTKGYLDHVVSLHSEAKSLLGESVVKQKRVLLEVGHGPHPRGFETGANAGDKKTTEYAMNLRRAKLAQSHIIKEGYQADVIDLCETLIDLGKHAKGYDAFVSFHLNAFNGSVQGTETYIHFDADAKDIALAKCIQSEVLKELKLTDREIQRHGYSILVESNKVTAACLTEAFFVDALKDTQKVIEFSDRSALAIAKGIIKYFKS